MDQVLHAADPLLAHFSGKRRSERVPFLHDVVASGSGGAFRSVVQDISEGGVLVKLDDARFYELAPRGTDGLALVQRAFPGGLEIHFSGTGVTLPADVVRITPLESGGIAVGCRFLAPLEEVERVLLGIHAARLCADRASASGPQLAADPDAALALLAFGGPTGLLGPAFLGAVVGAGPHALVAVSAPGLDDPRRVAETLAGTALRLVVRRGRRVLWEPAGRALHCRQARAGGVEVRFGADTELPRRLRRLFHARVTAVV